MKTNVGILVLALIATCIETGAIRQVPRAVDVPQQRSSQSFAGKKASELPVRRLSSATYKEATLPRAQQRRVMRNLPQRTQRFPGTQLALRGRGFRDSSAMKSDFEDFLGQRHSASFDAQKRQYRKTGALIFYLMRRGGFTRGLSRTRRVPVEAIGVASQKRANNLKSSRRSSLIRTGKRTEAV